MQFYFVSVLTFEHGLEGVGTVDGSVRKEVLVGNGIDKRGNKLE